jgi:hypothetical protein
LSAKLVPTFADREVSHGQCGGSPTAVISVFRPDFTRTFHKVLHQNIKIKQKTNKLIYIYIYMYKSDNQNKNGSDVEK